MQRNIENLILKPIFDYGATLQNNKLTIKQVVSEDEFVIWHEDLRTYMMMRIINNEEDVLKWINLPPHTNVASCFD